MGSPSRGAQGQQARGLPARRPGSPARSKSTANRLMALSGAVIVAVYTAGYARTEAVAQQANAAMAALRASATAGGGQSGSTSAPPLGSGASSPTAPAGSGSAAPPAGSASGTGTAAASTSTSASAAGGGSSAASTGGSSAGSAAAGAAASSAASSATSATKPAAPAYKNGSFTATGYGPHGPIQVTLVVKKGKITSANVTQCGTTYTCSYVQPLVQLVVKQQQAVADYVSGATASSYAYYQAVVNALAEA